MRDVRIELFMISQMLYGLNLIIRIIIRHEKVTKVRDVRIELFMISQMLYGHGNVKWSWGAYMTMEILYGHGVLIWP